MDTNVQRSNPLAGFDLSTATDRTFKQLVADYREYIKENPEPEKPKMKDGWGIFTPEHAIHFLYETVLNKANRIPRFETIAYYARQMEDQDWQKTGQPVIYNTAGQGVDGQHRAWASLLSGCSFPTYFVVSTPPHDSLFAYIDNCKPRTGADALETAGFDGHSKLLTGVVGIARRYDAGILTPSSKGKINKASPMENLRYIRAHDRIREAAKIMLGEYEEALGIMLRKDVGVFVGWKILEEFGEETLDQFMNKLIGADLEAKQSTDPIVALRKKLEQYAQADANSGRLVGGKKQKKTSWLLVLSHTIKAFNAWQSNEAVRTVQVKVDEEFPLFITAAEAEDEAA